MILKRFSIWDRLFAVLLVASSLFYFWGLKAVPFHPDESTQLFMSADFEALLTRPLTLVWQPGEDGDLRQRYRLLDAPLTRYLIGAGRMATDQPALAMDWDWSLGWKENSMAGAVPTPSQLDAARFAVASLFPLTLLFTYLTGKALVGGPAGLLAALLTATNALILLHTRRAMAESALIFGVTLTIWALSRTKSPGWLIGLALALAFNAKQSAAGLLPAGILALAWASPPAKNRICWASERWAGFLGVFFLVTTVLNPFLWSDPIPAALDALRLRQSFTQSQYDTIGSIAPNQLLSTPVDRGLALIANLYFTPPAIADVRNYVEETAVSAELYLSNPINDLLRSSLGGSLIFFLTLFGVAVYILEAFFGQGERLRQAVVVVAAVLSQFALLAATIPVPFQRYATPLVPFACLFSAIGIDRLVRLAARAAARLPLGSGHKPE